ncbi:DUF1127 domain-containing protein [Sinorhizobium saheli]|uniref:DUF1127 domain-containing protein n=1 Tax=Sinorhizobium saheli TaxID=36856 RepID=A0A178Y8S1_SINSA|nr:DUF1127 domain-containing protein [Sinorhizobium saheli]OAP43826.1 hypothetical protein ATB98_08045 [Sinorhizobium saheli]
MRDEQFVVADALGAKLDELCRKFGTWRTARTLMLAVWRRRHAANQTSHLSNRMRRDIGLPEDEDELLDVRFPLWDIRL